MHNAMLACTVDPVYDLMTLTYTELARAYPVKTAHGIPIGVVNRRGQRKSTICSVWGALKQRFIRERERDVLTHIYSFSPPETDTEIHYTFVHNM